MTNTLPRTPEEVYSAYMQARSDYDQQLRDWFNAKEAEIEARGRIKAAQITTGTTAAERRLSRNDDPEAHAFAMAVLAEAEQTQRTSELTVSFKERVLTGLGRDMDLLTTHLQNLGTHRKRSFVDVNNPGHVFAYPEEGDYIPVEEPKPASLDNDTVTRIIDAHRTGAPISLRCLTKKQNQPPKS